MEPINITIVHVTWEAIPIFNMFGPKAYEIIPEIYISTTL
jgi:hypothetical protein